MKNSFGETQLYQGFKDAGADLSALAAMPWPAVREDDWKYTDLAPLAGRSFRPAVRLEGMLPDRIKSVFIPGALNLLFVNGIFSEALSELKKVPSNCQIRIGVEAFAALKVLSGSLPVAARNDAPLFLGLNRAFLKDPILIDVPNDAVIQTPVHVIHLLNGAAEKSAIFPRAFLRVGRGARISVMETAVNFDGGEYFHNPVTEAVLGEGASLEYIQAHVQSPAAFHVGSLRFSLEKDARLHTFLLTGGARVFRNNLSVMLQGEGADVSLNGLHILKGENHADSHTFVDHIAPSAKSTQLYKNILDGKSHAAFNGKVFVRQQAQLTNSYQLNKSILLSPECRVDAKPQLEINADDVKCSHGTTVGQLSDDELFYLKTRAIDGAEAQRMLIRAFVDEVVNKIAEPSLRTAVGQMAGC